MIYYKKLYRNLKFEENEITYNCGSCSRRLDKSTLKLKIQFYKLSIEKFHEVIEDSIKLKEKFSRSAFLTFKNLEDYNAYCKNISRSSIGYIFRYMYYLLLYYVLCCFVSEENKKILKKNISFTYSPAYEPIDIIWENLRYSSMSKFLRSIVVYLTCFIILFISGVLISLLSLIDNHQQDSKYFFEKYIEPILITITIKIFNFLLTYSMRSLTV